VFSVVDKESFNRTRDFRDQIYRVLDNESVPFVLIGNKCDLQAKRQVSKKDAETLASEWGCSYIETSAKTKENVNEAYLKILRLIRDKKAADGSNTQKSKKKSRKCTIL
jgi:Ras-related protein Ral-A